MTHTANTTARMYLRWRDIDTWGHVTHSVYHDFLAEGRLALLAACVPDTFLDFVIARVELDYRREINHREGHVDVTSEIAEVGEKSLTLAQRIVLPDGSTAAESRSVMVGWDPTARGARKLFPEERIALLQGAKPEEAGQQSGDSSRSLELEL